MSDNKFVNFYIETCVTTLQEYLNNILQLKTHLKVANDLIAEKDAVIGTLMRELEEKKNVEAQYNLIVETNNALNEEMLTYKNKVSHLDTALSQVTEMKAMLQSKDKEIAELKNLEPEISNFVQLKKKKKEVVETEPAVNDF